MTFIHVFEYLSGLAVFGFLYWLLSGIRDEIIAGVTISGDIYDLYMYVWTGSIIIYLLFGGIWLARTYAELKEQGGIMF